MPILTVAVALMVVSMSAFAALTVYQRSQAPPSGLQQPPTLDEAMALYADEAGLIDSDLDGVPDALENFVYGSDPFNWNSSGTGIPDGWLARYGLDTSDPTIDRRPAATPPHDALPDVYGNAWPSHYTVTLWDIYSWQRPQDWDEATSGPFDNGLDPREWDTSGDGIPDGWLIHYGLDPLDGNTSAQRLAGADGLTVREAFQYNTDPTRLDTDGDGIPDREEIDGPANPRRADGGPATFPPSDPSAYSTTGSGVCDGYLVAHGLDPTDPQNAYRDLARSGATTIEKFNWSREHHGAAACTQGAGLDPTRASTLDGPIPDGWLIHYGLDPLDPDVPGSTTGSSQQHDGPELPVEAPDLDPLPDITLTVLDEYRYGRPSDWDEAASGPWWGGTDPTRLDTDGDGLLDAVEVRGYYVEVATDVGPDAPAIHYHTTSDATRADTSGNGLTDYEEVVMYGTDPARRDTDADGIPDADEVFLENGLDPTRADTAGDFLRDGARLAMLETRSAQYAQDPTYDFPGKPGETRKVTDWAASLPGAEGLPTPLSAADLQDLLGPDGDIDGDGVANLLDPDMDGDGLLNGWEVDPALYRHSHFGSGPIARPPTDPFNPDTDGDGLVDGWEVGNGLPRFDISPPRYTLDPSRWDSDDDGESDAEEDPDGDSAAWTSFRTEGAQIVPEPHEHPFPNLDEQQFGTDPNDLDSDDDGIGDGWKVFWGLVYPTLGNDPALGVHYPGSPGPLAIPPGAPRPALKVDQSEVELPVGTYTRFLLDTGDMIAGQETLAATFPSIPDLENGGSRTVYEVTGTLRFTLKDAYDAGTNPYLQDTSGDGVPDAWALFFQALPPGTPETAGQCSSDVGLDPLLNYEGVDLLGDGLTVPERFAAGLHALCLDTDLDGLVDAEEIELGLDPLDPEDAQTLTGVNDRDGDGLLDFEEIVGTTYDDRPELGRVRTDPDLPDSNGDGLLDGRDRLLDPDDPDDAPWLKLFLDLGVSYTKKPDGTYLFRGAVDQFGADPDQGVSGVPAGWLVARGRSPTDSGHLQSYAVRMPAWWDHTAHGPWWGGVGPGVSPPEGNDHDGDGLLDAEGASGFEDPMPGNRLNAWRDLDWDSYPASLGLVAPPDGPHPADDVPLDPLVRRLLAQSYLNPRAVENNFIAFKPEPLPSRQQPCIDLDAGDGYGLRDPATDGPTSTLLKGEETPLRGRVHDCSTGAGLHGVTVEARFGNPPQVFGAAFTDATGAFEVPVNISRDHSAALPDGASVVLRGSTQGVVEWTSDPAMVPPGSNQALQVRTYATPSLQSRSTNIPITVEADSLLSLNAPSDVVTGPLFTVTYRLTDSGGAPLQDRVHFSWAGQSIGSTPAPDGSGSVALPARHEQRGLSTLQAQTSPASPHLTPAFAEKDIRLRNPIDIQLVGAPASVAAGSEPVTSGRVAFRGAGVPGIPVSVILGGGLEPIVEAEAVSGPDGSFQVTLPIPADQANGQYTLVATALQTDETVRIQTAEGVTLRSIPRFTEVSTGEIAQGGPIEVAGRLLEPDARPIQDVAILVDVHGGQTTATTDATGRFRVNVSADLPVQPVAQTLRFAGDALHVPVTDDRERSVVSPSNLTVPKGTLPRGQDLDLALNLTDAAGNPIANAPVRVTWGSEDPVHLITDANGQATLHRAGDPEDAIGVVVVRAEYAGSPDGGYAAATAAATWKVITTAEVVLPDGFFEAGRSIPLGVLRDAGTHAPLARLPVTLLLEPGGASNHTTDADGRFLVMDAVERNRTAFQVKVRADFAGNDAYGPVRADSLLRIRTPVTLDVHAPSTLVTGREAVVTTHVHPLDGGKVLDGFIHITLDGTPLALLPVRDGVARGPIAAPPSETPGARVLEFSYERSETHAPTSVEETVDVLGSVQLTITTDPARPGGTSIVRVLAHNDGQPVPFSPIYLQVEGLEGGLVGTTDEDGLATFELEQPQRKVQLAARYGGDPMLSPSHSSGELVPSSRLDALAEAADVFPWVSLAIAILLVALANAAYFLRRSPLEPVLRRVRRILVGGGPLEQQIFLAYRELEEAAIGHGYLLDVAETPRSLEQAIAPHVPAQAHSHLDRLISLFEAARYGAEAVLPGQRDRALEALDEIRRAMRAEAGMSWRRSKTPTGVGA